jgi:hypothetical protein
VSGARLTGQERSSPPGRPIGVALGCTPHTAAHPIHRSEPSSDSVFRVLLRSGALQHPAGTGDGSRAAAAGVDPGSDMKMPRRCGALCSINQRDHVLSATLHYVAAEVSEAPDALSKLEANSSSIAVLRIKSTASVVKKRSMRCSVPVVYDQSGPGINTGSEPGLLDWSGPFR